MFAVIAAVLIAGSAAASSDEGNGQASGNQVEPVTANYSAWGDMMAEACYSAPSHDVADLCAQWRAAKANEQAAGSAGWANYIAVIAVLISAIGMVGLFGTFWQANEALKESRKAAKAAEDSVVEVQRIGEAQVRCYLCIEDVKVRLREQDDNPVVSFAVRNCGQSPAREACLSVRISYADSTKLRKKRSSGYIGRDRRIFLAPNANHRDAAVYDFPMQAKEAALAKSSALAVVVTLRVEAMDVFKKPVKLQARFGRTRVQLNEEIDLLPLSSVEDF